MSSRSTSKAFEVYLIDSTMQLLKRLASSREVRRSIYGSSQAVTSMTGVLLI